MVYSYVLSTQREPGFFYVQPDDGIAISPVDRWQRTLSHIQYYELPLGLPLLLFALITFLLWRLDRRPPPTHCQSCGYDLTGNLSGICPECGMARAKTGQVVP